MDLSGLQRQARAAAPEPTTYSAQVVRADESGLWVAIIGDDVSSPIGPCKGGWTANGTRVPPGALVALVMTADGPWAIGVDNPALAINDATLAPFVNPSFEAGAGLATTGAPGGGWSDFWSQVRRYAGTDAVPLGKYRRIVVEGVAAHGLRCLQTEGHGTSSTNESGEWSVPAGSSIEVSVYARGAGDAPRLNLTLWSNVAGQYAGPFGSGSNQTVALDAVPGTDWLRYRGIVTLPPTHTRANLFVDAGHNDQLVPNGTSFVWIDNIDADLVEINPAAEHIDYMRRAPLTMLGGGTRTVTAGGNVAWSQPFTIAGAGMVASEALDGRFAIVQPPNGTAIPVHSSGARTSHTVAGGVITLNPDDALWYALPLGAAATSQPARFHIVGSSSADNYVVPPHWILIVRRASAWSSTSHAPEYKWGDGRLHDPWRTPSLNAGWSAGTIPPRYRKEQNGDVSMRGRVAGGTFDAFTLPDGYWPPAAVENMVRDGMGMVGMVTVSAAGVVRPINNNADHSIAIRFSTEP